MSNFTPVKPGQLITAAYFNQVFGAFDSRITALEAVSGTKGQTVIQQLLPLGTFHVQDEMHIIGQNFGLPSQVTVTIGGQNVTQFKAGSGDTELIFDIPAVQGLSQGGTMVSLTVDNTTSPAPASTTFMLFPLQITSPSGSILVSMTGPPTVGTITAGNFYIYIFTITGFTSLSDKYAITTGLDAASAGAGWSIAAVDPTDPTGQKLISSVTIPQGQNTSTQVGIKVTIPSPAGVASGQVSLSLASSLKPGVSGSGATAVNVGSAPPPPNQIGLTIFSTGTGTLSADGSSISLPKGTGSVMIVFLASLPDGGAGVTYTVAPLKFNDTSWSARLLSPSDIPVGTPNSTAQIRFSVSVPAGPNSTTMTLAVSEDGKPSVQGQQPFTISVAGP
jgi:hypothetical protein